ncbi:hypothetical protein BUMB_00080c [Candidatus Paraburkholderia calva]|nr:hypothetical protein BUMB_00080c [Candidatus Paraburkholderia calva]
MIFPTSPTLQSVCKVVGHVHTPILMRELKGEDALELIAGERRVCGSTQNGWTEIPAKIFPADTPDLKIRIYQVSENVDRKELSLRETSVGLAADVERFGCEEASRIWTAPNGKQRSVSWILKHLRFQKYRPITRELSDANQFDDIEAANKMADIENISTDAAAKLAAEICAEMRVGRKIGRFTLDARLNLLKERHAQQDTPDQLSAASEMPVAVEQDATLPSARDVESDAASGAHSCRP